MSNNSETLITILRVLLALVIVAGCVYPGVLIYLQRKREARHLQREEEMKTQILDLIKIIIASNKLKHTEREEDNS